MQVFVVAVIAFPLILALVTAGLPTVWWRWSSRLALLAPCLALVVGGVVWNQLASNASLLVSYAWLPALGINANLLADRLACFFVMLIGAIGMAIIQYSRYYFGAETPRGYWPLLLGFMGSMLGLILADSLILLYVFWEATTVTSALLIGLNGDIPKARQAGIQAFLVTGLGGLALLAGILLLGEIGGTYELSQLARRASLVSSSPLHSLALVLIAIGAFAKSAQWPLHFWLPAAMTAPAPISAYLHSATMVNAGVYLLGRCLPIFGHSPLWQPLLAGVGVTTFLLGSWSAYRALDLKQLLAYGTVAYLGVLTSLYAYAPLVGPKGEMLHFANHAFYKSALFLLLGWLERVAGTRRVDILDEQYWLPRKPFEMLLFTIGAMAMAGGPFLLAFESKKLFFAVIMEKSRHNWLILSAVFLGSSLTVAAALKLSLSTLWGHKDPPEPRKPISRWLVGLPALLLLPQLIGGLSPAWVLDHFEALPSWVDRATFWSDFDSSSYVKLAVFGLGIALFLGWRSAKNLPHLLRMESVMKRLVLKILNTTARLRRGMQAGGYPRYLAITFVLATALALVALLNLPRPWPMLSQARLFDALGALLPAGIIILGATLALTLTTRLSKLIGTGLAGYGVTLFYVMLRAPDLALTQVLAETISLLLLLLAFRHLAPMPPDERPLLQRCVHVIIAASLGTSIGALLLTAHHTDVALRGGQQHLERALPEAGGRNVVNVILTDFRAGDTLAEIAVLVIAVLGIFTLLDSRRTP